MPLKRILAGAAVIAALVSAGVAQPASAAGGTPGSVDTSFGHNGTAVVDLGLTAAGQARLGTPRTVIVLGNGDLLVGGDLGVVRLRPGGSLDPAFGQNGYAPVGFSVANVVGLTGLTVQPDGKILWLGSTPVPNGATGGNINQFAVERFTANGAPDPTFGRHGVVTTNVPTGGFGGESAQTAVVQPDGKIVVGGFTGTFGRTGADHAALIRYNPSGSLDTSFGHSGIVQSAGLGNVTAVGLDAAGDIFTLPGEAEFTPAGVQDAHVSAAPITASTPSPLNGNEVSGSVAFLPTGQSLAGGLVGETIIGDTDAQVQRLNADGSLDPAFASPPIDFNGIEGGRSASGVDSLAVQPDGKILVGGAVGLARVNANGTLDTTFGAGGTELAVPATLPPVILANASLLAVLPGAKFLALGAGTNPATGATELILTRYFQ